jgi:xylose isomerase
MPNLVYEGLSWEDRKRLLLQQLDTDESEFPEQAQAKRLEIQDVLRATEIELERREREITELRSLLEQQAQARQGIAVGAAAVAELVESNELVQQERERLRAIQHDWEDKLRQGEIDLSMERARLARERLQLEKQKQHIEQLKQQLDRQKSRLEAATLENREPSTKLGSASNPDSSSLHWLCRLGRKDKL